MPERLDLSFSDVAENDIDEITQFTTEHWDPEQARKYASMLFAATDRLTRYPLSGKSLEDLGVPTRVAIVGEHAIIYRITTTAVHILRIVHQRRVGPHLFDTL
jgi:toxin ParE1/3/4